MEIIRRDTDYAIRGLIHLALAKGGPMSCAVIADACDIPKIFAHKILKKMADAGIVTSRTGRSGGFQLKKKLKQIPLGEVVETLQGRLYVSRCVLNDDACARKADCPVSVEWRKLQKGIVDFLKNTTLNDLLTSLKPARKRAKRRKAAAPDLLHW